MVMEQPEIDFESMTEVSTLWEDLLWPFKKYDEVRDFISREGPASLVIGLTGILMTELGISPGIASAVGILGFATSLTKFILMILFSTEKPLDELGLAGGGISTLIYFISGFGLFIIYGPGDITNITPSIVQFVAGVAITYLAGYVYMRTHTHLEKSGASVSAKVGIPAMVALGLILGLVTFTPALFRALGRDTAADLLTKKPADIEMSLMA